MTSEEIIFFVDHIKKSLDYMIERMDICNAYKEPPTPKEILSAIQVDLDILTEKIANIDYYARNPLPRLTTCVNTIDEER